MVLAENYGSVRETAYSDNIVPLPGKFAPFHLAMTLQNLGTLCGLSDIFLLSPVFIYSPYEPSIGNLLFSIGLRWILINF